MRTLTNRLFKTYRRLSDGSKFHGYLSASPLSQVGNKAPLRIMLVKLPCLIKPGDCFRTEFNGKAILMDHPDVQDGTRAFKVAHLNEERLWEPHLDLTDQITRQASNRIYPELNRKKIWVNFDAIPDAFIDQHEVDEYRVIVGEDVKVGDKIGGRLVKHVVVALGVKIVELQ